MTHAIVWLLTAVLYSPVFSQLYLGRWKSSDYTHAYFILPVFFWLVWRKRGILRELIYQRIPGNSTIGLAALAGGVGMFMFGWYFDYLFLTSLSLIPVIYGLIRYQYGKDVVRALAFPILYLLLIPPIPVGIVDSMTLPLRYGVSIATEIVLKIFHYPVGREGLLLLIGENELFMGQPCSGFRTIISMFSLALVYVYISKGNLLKKALLSSFIIPISVFSNFVRVVAICLITYYFGEAAGQGFFHGFSGVLLFAITIMGLLGLEYLLGKWMKQSKNQERAFAHGDKHPDIIQIPGAPRVSLANSPPLSFTGYFAKGAKDVKGWSSSVILLIAVIGTFGLPKAKYEGTDILSQIKVPLEINGWQGSNARQELSEEEKNFGFISDFFDREYVHKDGKNLYWLVLDAGNFHNPKVCSGGAGFKVTELNDARISLYNRTFVARCLYVENDTDGYLMIYWMCIDKNIVTWTGQKIKELWYSLTNKKKAGLMIRFDIPCNKDTIEDALKLAEKFMADLHQVLPADQLEYIFGRIK